ncbi:MAG TPA: Ig-like domain-containing protein [Longimicrobiales bacterium]|nr:Ig-like domain-containing protein [Longimicrobiales bacterium]
MNAYRLLLTAVLAAVAGCARAYPPPGGERDTQPPRLVETVPAALTVIPPGTDPVVFRFDERLSERNFSEALVTVSPLDGALRVERRRHEVSVAIDGGWRADRVYRVVLLPGPRDLFGNAREEPAELVFSTGPPVPETAIYGTVLDRITERAAQRPVITAVRRADDVTYIAVGDSGGFYALRHLPYGVYDVRAFSDQNSNRRRDSLEPVDSGRVATLQAGDDTTAVFFRVLVPDTSAARVTAAAVIDSMRVRVTVDDYLDAETAFADATAEVLALPDSARYTGAASLTLGAPQSRPGRAGAEPADSAARPLPAREVIVLLERVLAPGTYVMRVRGLTNISGVPGGGGTAQFEVRAPAVPPAVRRDTTGIGRHR